MLKYIYILGGTISLSLGFLGLIVPGIPTTPFVLLTGFLYAKSSPRLYSRLEKNKLTGACLRGVKDGFSLKVRLFLLMLMWTMVSITAFVVFRDGVMFYVMFGLGVIGTISQLLFVKKKRPIVEILIDESDEKSNDSYRK
ncbi:DUF454 domain-containing protein [Dysgonomonas sp. 216]|uniref:YbaN family protein n=1 Tax=Dysgonomonas sp. 216 TaxID=2302934 RepID=UPI0013D6FF66|nr:YbaN family protein [Dysgonomonas sp. 216]NDW17836.1 DUF454 domain-containing protein [Dysgonomonas sp. 216]